MVIFFPGEIMHEMIYCSVEIVTHKKIPHWCYKERRKMIMKNKIVMAFCLGFTIYLIGCGAKTTGNGSSVAGGTVSDMPVNSSTTDVGKTEQATYEDTDEIITYNGKEYHKSELCDATLRWLELSENEQLLSSYMPPEFIEFEENWGITLTLDNVTPSGGIIKCTQSGGKATGKLQTGSSYIIEKWTQENGWQECDYYAEVEWTEEAWIIAKDTVSEWEVDWEWIYGKLPKGKYRIGKEIMDFRETGDYDTVMYFAEFYIE